MITEINLVVKGSNANRQTFTSDDIMTLKKEEERKSIPNKSGGVFNKLFRRGKSSNVTTAAPPPVKEPTIQIHREESLSMPKPLPPKTELQMEKPKIPQRKRRPAPKPPQPVEIQPEPTEKDIPPEPVQLRNGSVISDSSNVSENGGKHESGVTICHSRHSSDSSGYHETSILSDQCNTSLPRRNRMEADTMGRLKLNRYSESTGNLTKMTSHSRSTSSLIFPGRKKKAAPPPPQPFQKPTSSTTNLESLSPVVASQTPLSTSSSKTDLSLASQGTQKTTNPPPIPRRRKGPVPTPQNTMLEEENCEILETDNTSLVTEESLYSCPYQTDGTHLRETPESSRPPSNMSTIDILRSLEYLNLDDQGNEIKPPEIIGLLPKSNKIDEEKIADEEVLPKRPFILNLVDKNVDDDNTSVTTESPIKNEMTSLISDISSVDVPPRKKFFNKEFSISSVKSSESVLFEEGGMRRWGSWDKLNVSSVTSSPIDEIPTSSLQESQEIPTKEEIIEMKIEDVPVPNNDISSQKLITTNEEEIGNMQKPISGAKHMVRSVSQCIDSTESATQMDCNRNGIDGVLSDEDVSSTSSHPGHKTSVSTDNTCSNIRTDAPIEEKEIVISGSLFTTDVINEISLDDVERFKNYGNSPDSGNSSEISEKSKIDDELTNPEILDVLTVNEDVVEEWQLPSPPKAFKDTYPSNRPIETTETDCVITPELIEKLERIEKEQSLQKESSDTCNEEDFILNKLSLENLEKRKSLVYNRELATSLKLSYESQAAKKDAGQSNPTKINPPTSIENKKEESRKDVAKTTKHSTLPNFKITTYEEPKQVKVFEDDTIRSNSDFPGKSLSLNRGEQVLQKNVIGSSMENISTHKTEVASDHVKDPEHRIFRQLKGDHYRRQVNRSGSFSVEQNEWSPTRRVSRSKSQVALRKEERRSNSFETTNMTKSSSLFDVSGLQSLEVMKKIQNKLNTPTTSMETLSKIEPKNEVEAKPKVVNEEEIPKKKYQYTGPPSINMGTWSDRPKLPVSVKEDADYKLGLGTNKRYVQNGSQTLDVRPLRYTNGMSSKPSESQRVTVTCNGTSEQHNDFNVLIKIGDQTRKPQDQVIESMYKNSYSMNRNTQRPHSVALPSDFDISRVPVVRSVELKKNYRDITNNTSVIQLNKSNESYHTNGFTERNTEYQTHELHINGREVTKPVMRAKSFLQPAPVVRGFRPIDNNTNTTGKINAKVENYNRFSWQPTTSSTLPATQKKENFTTNQNVPFSRFNLRRTESKASRDDIENNNEINMGTFKPNVEIQHQKSVFVNSTAKPEIPKPPPQMPKTVQKKIANRQFVPVLDPRDELLKSIRDFGGKKGLRSRKA